MTKSARGATTPAAFAAHEHASLRKSSFHDIGAVAAPNAAALRFFAPIDSACGSVPIVGVTTPFGSGGL